MQWQVVPCDDVNLLFQYLEMRYHSKPLLLMAYIFGIISPVSRQSGQCPKQANNVCLPYTYMYMYTYNDIFSNSLGYSVASAALIPNEQVLGGATAVSDDVHGRDDVRASGGTGERH